ncbi:MAG: nitroreductase, partial [Muribaculaceae bacterium]|nr:nitroreductase [Muribaculaceae bacterium]
MTLYEAIQARHSVRKYKSSPLSTEAKEALEAKIQEVNAEGNLHIQLICDEPKAFTGVFAYGKFSGVTNYLVMAGKKAKDLDERIGYYGEQLVLLAQQLGLNTCWAGLSYRKVENTYALADGEKICCYIALGYGETQGVSHKIKSAKEISNVSDITPQWFKDGIEA